MGRQDLIIDERIKKLHELRKQGIDPYPNKFEVSHSSTQLQEKYSSLKPEKYTKDEVKIAGRLLTFRDMGKIAFGTLNDGYGKIQVVFQDKETPKKAIEFFKKYIDSGDFIGIDGLVFRTKRGELSVLVKNMTLLSKSILPLPEKWHGLQDDEERLRKRYLDILMNPEVKEIFEKRAKIIDVIRSLLKEKGFLSKKEREQMKKTQNQELFQ